MKVGLLLVGLVWASMSFAVVPLTQDQKLSELRQLTDMVKSGYGPYQLKQQTLHLDADQLLAKYAKKAEGLSNLDFYYLLNQFVAEFQDSHFASRLNSDHISYLGFATDRIQGKVLIDDIDTTLLPPKAFPFKPGDEVVSFGGKDINGVLEDLGSYIGSGSHESLLRISAMYLTYRAASTLPPQTGDVVIRIRSQDSGKIGEPVKLTWLQQGGPVEEAGQGWGGSPLKTDFMKLSLRDYFQWVPKVERAYLCSPKTRINPPQGATILMGGDSDPFVAYYYPTPAGNVGYLRMPHYDWGSDAPTRLKQYEWAVYQMEQNTVGLIIDQDHNCGGDIDFLEEIVRLFAEKPFVGVQFQFLASRSDYFTFKGAADEEAEHTLSQMDVGNILATVKTAWMHGDPMTPKISFEGNRVLQPATVHYTKPIIVLADEMSGSGGDAFPALMQGIGRAKILGNRTMGAGGNVVDAGTLNYSGNDIHLTKSLFYHPNGRPIENNGVAPDYPYLPTEYDFMNGYECYEKFYTKKMLELVSAESQGTGFNGAAANADPNCP